jgi:hypothetical protein
MKTPLPLSLFLVLLLDFFAATASTSSLADRQLILEALQSVRSPIRNSVEYNYIMTARLRLIFFWVGKDDVGGGYIRRGISSQDPRAEFIQLLFGSDPQKAPRAVNRWGAGTEVAWHKDPVSLPSREDDVTSSAFFGFMKSSRGKSVGEMQKELRKEQEQGQHAFTGILSRVDSSRALSTVVPLLSDTDFNLHQYNLAQPLMLDRIAASESPVRSLEASSRCSRSADFLASVADLMDAALAGQAAPLSRCYIHDAEENTLTLETITAVRNFPVQLHGPKNTVLLDTSYSNLLQLDCISTHKETGKTSSFSISVGTQGNLRGVPVQIRYQPNWWFQVVLNLRPDSHFVLNSAPARLTRPQSR